MMALPPKETAKFIADNASFVTIKNEGIEKLGDVLIDEINSGRLKTSNFSQAEVHPSPDNPNALDWLFVVDTLNFCFWHHENEEGDYNNNFLS